MNDLKNNQSIFHFTDQLIRYYKVPFRSKKEDVLNAVLEKTEQKEGKHIRKNKKIFMVATVSAAATLALLVVLYFFTATVSVSSEKNEIVTHRLPDNSRVVLHEDSRISYSKYLWKSRVKLQGEAYFEVEKGEGFQVKTRLGDVEVLGTRFLVDGWNKQLKVQCFQGSVKTSFGNNSWTLEPGTQFTGKNETAQKNTFTNRTGYPGFAQFRKDFSDTPLDEVIREIETFFGVKIYLKASPGKNFSGAFETGSLENALQIVCVPLQLDYVFENKYKITIK